MAVFKRGGVYWYEFNFGGVKLTYGPNKNQGSNQVFFTILQADGTFKPVDRLGMEGQ